MKTESSLTVASSSNTLYVRFDGMGDDYICDTYMTFLAKQRKRLKQQPWARVVDLTDMVLATPETNKTISSSLVDDADSGLCLEIILPPSLSLSQWQVDNTIESIKNRVNIQFVDSMVAAEKILHDHGFDSVFLHEAKYTSKHTQ